MLSREQIAIIIKECCDNKPQAQEAIFRAYYPFVMRIALRFSNHEPDAVDIASDSFLRIFRYMRTYDPSKSEIAAWIKRIVINQAIDYYKKKEKYIDIEKAELSELNTIDNFSISHLENKQLLLLIQQLHPLRRTIFNLYVIEGFKHKEIAEMTGLSENTSKWHLAEAKKQLQEMVIKLELR